MELPDVQGRQMSSSYNLSRVGVKGIKRPVTIHRPGKDVSLIPSIDVMVNLPAQQRGSHMSRHVEVIHSAVDSALDMANDSLEAFVERIALSLLESHEYATYAEIALKADYFREQTSPDGRAVLENYVIAANASIRRGDSRPLRTIGVEVSGMSACPCAMETVRKLLSEELSERGASPEQIKVLELIPVPTHNQKNRVELYLSSKDGVIMDADELIDIVERNLSSPTYEILKRMGEAKLVLEAHRKPKFVEDIVRDIIDDLLGSHPELDDDVVIRVRSVSEESIHKHDALAERISTLGELRVGSRHQR